ncbi:MAG: T9SS type A sorting domain-containing protein [Bacteroidetes bacterium]|nr:T9SS type A sorting domain-containing protein [Bacteroidota bacterium]
MGSHGGDFSNWPDLGRSGSENMVLDTNGFPVSCISSDYHILRNWDGIRWNSLTSSASIYETGTSSPINSLKFSSNGQAFLSAYTISNSLLTVLRWNGIAWDTLGGQPFSQVYGGGFMVLDSLENPIVVIGDDLIDSVVVKRWDGLTWNNLPSTNLDRLSVPIAMSRDHSGKIYLAVTNNPSQSLNILCFDGSTWQTIGTQLNQSPYIIPIMNLDSAGFPLVSYMDFSGNVYFTRWDGTTWISMGSFYVNYYAKCYDVKIDNENNIIVAFRDAVSDRKLTVKKWDGFNWITLGTDGISNGHVGEIYLGLNDSNNIYVQYRDFGQMQRVCVQNWNGVDWNYVGEGGVSKDVAKYRTMALDRAGKPFVAYSDQSQNYKITVRHWNDTIWSDVGNAGFSPSGAGHLIMTLDTSDYPIVAFQDSSIGNKLSVKRWDGSTWNFVGDSTGLSGGVCKYIGLTLNSLNHPVISFPDSISGGKTITKEWDGTSWNQLGTTSNFSQKNIYQCLTVDSLNNLYVVFIDDLSGGRPGVKMWNGSTWNTIGPAVIGNDRAYQSNIIIDQLGNPIISIVIDDPQYNYRTVVVYRFNGTIWNRISSSYGVNFDTASDPNLAIDQTGNLYVAFYNHEKVEVRKYNGGVNWINVAGSNLPGGVDYDTNNNRWFEIDNQGNMFIAFNIGYPYVLKLGNTLTNVGTIPLEENNFNIYPNPANDQVTIVFFSAKRSFYESVFLDMNGRVLNKKNGTTSVGENSINFETKHMANGIYFIKILTEGKQTMKKLIVQN